MARGAFPGPLGTGDARALAGGFCGRLSNGRGEVETGDFRGAKISTDGIGRAIGQGTT